MQVRALINMKIEEQVVSLELAKKLKELGVKQASFVYWTESADGWGLRSLGELRGVTDEIYSAFTVAELSEILNLELTDSSEGESFTLQCSNAIDFWAVAFGNDDITVTPQFENAKLADALAEILLHLLEENIIEAPH